MHNAGPQIAGKYEILARLRDGGMGSIYKVRHRLLEEVRVIKVMRPHAAADADLKSRFVEEAKMATRLKHPNIATIYDFAIDDDGTAFLVLEYIDGITLADLSESDESPGVALSLEIAHQALLALGYLHRKNVVHRDISPDNLMLTQDDQGRPLVKLIDLGIAKALDKPGAMTSTGIFLGKVKYASPEQFGSLSKGEKLDGRSDLYSLGIVLYEILTGRPPFVGETPTEFMRAHVFQPPIPFSETDPEGKIPAELRAIVLRALEKKREDRFASAERLDEEIVALQSRLSGLESLKGTQILLSRFQTLPAPRPSSVPTSDQDRLNRHFAAQSTPTPSPTQTPTQIRPVARRLDSPRAETRPKRAYLWPLVAAAAVSLLIAVILRRGTREPDPPRVTSSIRPLATPAAAASPAVGPATITESIATVSTAPLARAEPTPPDPSPKNTSALSRSMVIVGGISPVGEKRSAKQEPRQLSQSSGAASPSPEQALFGVTPPPPERARLPEPTALAVELISRTAQPQTTAAPLASETDSIRQLLQEYQRAINTLDVNLYIRTFPSFAGERRRHLETSWSGLRSQHAELDNLRIELMGSRARVHARRSVVAVPLVGTEQHDVRECVFSLEKRDNSWVINALD